MAATGQWPESERLPPLLLVIYEALRERGWTLGDDRDRAMTYFEDPEGNRWYDLERAILAQSLREIAVAGGDEQGRDH
ncbi:hypothetical protein [Candidatus Solirubrobacter pratensis]|uniref:hypothetical protein n=1 Tax=Candidatus Solirubrobacter pratensis TaxID=1298857 RepID=UPI0003F92169|nr:hypothetical protein [Candidatus Solirubrobacter pratensis]